MLASPVTGIEEETELGPGVYIFTTFRGIFQTHGFINYEEVENSIVKCLLKASEIWNSTQSISRIDLYAKVLQNESILATEISGSLLLEIYLVKKNIKWSM